MAVEKAQLANTSVDLAAQGAEQLAAADAAAEVALDTAVDGINEIAEGAANLDEQAQDKNFRCWILIKD